MVGYRESYRMQFSRRGLYVFERHDIIGDLLMARLLEGGLTVGAGSYLNDATFRDHRVLVQYVKSSLGALLVSLGLWIFALEGVGRWKLSFQGSLSVVSVSALGAILFAYLSAVEIVTRCRSTAVYRPRPSMGVRLVLAVLLIGVPTRLVAGAYNLAAEEELFWLMWGLVAGLALGTLIFERAHGVTLWVRVSRERPYRGQWLAFSVRPAGVGRNNA